MTSVALREKVDQLQTALSKLPQWELETKEWIAFGNYYRVVKHPAGVMVVGRVHKKDHLFCVLEGQVNIMTDDGVVEMAAPYIVYAKAGSKKVAWAPVDAVVMTIHKVITENLEEVEKEIVEEDENSLFDSHNKLKNPELSFNKFIEGGNKE